MKQGFRGWVPLALMVLLMAIIGAYTQSKESSFLSAFSFQGLFIAAIPLALAAMGQTNALMVRCFDVSIGALITLAVVIASFTIPDPSSFGEASSSGCSRSSAPAWSSGSRTSC